MANLVRYLMTEPRDRLARSLRTVKTLERCFRPLVKSDVAVRLL
jgi:hypothetical protein